MISLRSRAGLTLIELLLFVGLLGLSMGLIFPVLFSSVENRMLQQTIAVVEQNSTHLLQTMSTHIHQAERILDPIMGSTGSVLALQTGSGTATPTIVGMESGSLVLIRRLSKRTLSSPEVAITRFVARNTSVSTARQSVHISFDATRTIRLSAPHTYTQHFEAVFTLLPDDELLRTGCTCIVPVCQAVDSYLWQVCNQGICDSAQTPLICP